MKEKICSGNLKTDHLGNLDIDGVIILNEV